MRVAVTGGCGFVGSHVVDVLGELGHRVRVIDRVHPTEPIDITLDLEPEDLEGVEAVIHCAAHADISRNWRGGLRSIWSDNMLATWMLLQACAEAPSVRTFVFASSACVYGGGDEVRTERDVVRAASPYAASKLAGEALVEAFANRLEWRWHAARLVSCVGERYQHGHVADFVRRARGGGAPVQALDDGAHPKSFVHVRDAAAALVAMAIGHVPSGIFNVASEETWSWRDTARVMGVEVRPSLERAGWIGDPVGLRVSAEKLAPWWRAQRKVEDGVRDALASLGWKGAVAA